MIYFIQAGDGGPVKIGFAEDIRKRFCQLQIANHEELRLIGAMPGGLTHEHRLHEQFMEDHIRGEWFRPSERLLRTASKQTKGEIFQWAIGQSKKRPRDDLRSLKDQEAEALAAIERDPDWATPYRHRYGPRRKFSKRLAPTP